MRLSDVKGDRTLDVIADIIEPIANIAEDEQSVSLFKREVVPEGTNIRNYTINRLKKGVPSLIRRHKNDIIAILSTIGGVSPEEYRGALNLVKLTRDLLDLITDDAFVAFFTPAQSGDSYGSAPENTEDPGV